MRIEVIPQVELGNVQRVRIGDFLNSAIADDSYQRFLFAVAFMRVSGWDRLAGSVDNLLNRGGRISGAIGIDQGITTIEALETLSQVSNDSTIFFTVSGFIYHPKLYLMSGEKRAVSVIGSANLTRDGLFRNIELATAIYLDFESSIDLEVYRRYENIFNELLNPSHPNVQKITNTTLEILAKANLIKREAQVVDPGPALRSRRARKKSQVPTELERLFPPLRVPVAPPSGRVVPQRFPARPPIIIPPTTVGISKAFIMQLSSFDSSHRTGVPGTPEVLIPHTAIDFFPRLSLSGRKYPDVQFDVVLYTPMGRERHHYRLWYYEERATGTKIDEYRLRMNHDTIDLTTPGGGDLLVVNKLPEGNDPAYEVTILPQTDPTFPAFFALCKQDAQGKKWGVI